MIMRHMLPRLRDLRDLQDMLAYNLGLYSQRPFLGEFSYVEKLEYFAYIWGTIAMAVSGFILWFNTLALRYFPKWVLDASAALHYYEAILATFAILIWHMYSVIFDPDVYPMDRVELPLPSNKADARPVPPTLAASSIPSSAIRDADAGAESQQTSKPESG
jgi:hypothetical protein